MWILSCVTFSQAAYVMVESEKKEEVKERAIKAAEERVLDVYVAWWHRRRSDKKCASLYQAGKLADRMLKSKSKRAFQCWRDDSWDGRDGHESSRRALERDAQT